MSDREAAASPGPVREGSRLRRIVAAVDSEPLRFLVVGALNTVIGYGLFVALEVLVGRHTSYFVSLYVAYLTAAVIGFLLHRRFTFRASGSGRIVREFLRYQSVSLVALALNSVALPLLVELVGLIPIVSQLVIVVVTTVVSYVGHKYLSFRRPRVVPGASEPSGG